MSPISAWKQFEIVSGFSSSELGRVRRFVRRDVSHVRDLTREELNQQLTALSRHRRDRDVFVNFSPAAQAWKAYVGTPGMPLSLAMAVRFHLSLSQSEGGRMTPEEAIRAVQSMSIDYSNDLLLLPGGDKMLRKVVPLRQEILDMVLGVLHMFTDDKGIEL